MVPSKPVMVEHPPKHANGTTNSFASFPTRNSLHQQVRDKEQHQQQVEEQEDILYHHGFGNHFESESVPNTLPRGRNNPKQCPGNLYAEQLSGTAFTAPRGLNRRVWLYRTQPSVAGTSNRFIDLKKYFGNCDWQKDMRLDPNPMRWGPMPLVGEDLDLDEEEGLIGTKGVTFVEGTRTMMGCGDPIVKSGMAIHEYSFNANMRHSFQAEQQDQGEEALDEHMYNSDGDFLFVPQLGSLDVVTELGRMVVHPKEIFVIPRGVVFSVNMYSVPSSAENTENNNGVNTPNKTQCHPTGCRGYILEVFKGHFILPELGPIGSNGLANARDFQTPKAHYETDLDVSCRPCTILNKFGNSLFARTSPRSPYNVVAWHGNYVPFKYNLQNFCAMNSVTYDHPDPSIYTVLTVPSDEIGTALADFVIFPPRVMATDKDTFRPPWFHRNCMSEFMGLIYGAYDAKRNGFVPGGASLHNCMTPHGPDSETFNAASTAECSSPCKFDGGLAFMFETSCILKVTEYALNCKQRDLDYAKCWDGLKDNFRGEDIEEK